MATGPSHSVLVAASQQPRHTESQQIHTVTLRGSHCQRPSSQRRTPRLQEVHVPKSLSGLQVCLIPDVCPCHGAGSVHSTRYTSMTFRLDEALDGKICFDHPPACPIGQMRKLRSREGKSFTLSHTAPAVAELDQSLGLLAPWISEGMFLALSFKPVPLPQFPHVENSFSALPSKMLRLIFSKIPHPLWE